MELTKKDRLMLINQYEILKLLDDDNESHYSELIEILTDGYEIFYSDFDERLSDDMPQSEGRLVLDVLSIYRSIETYKANNPNDEGVVNHHWGYFQGFDGNDESAYRAFTLFLIDTQEKFTEQAVYKDSTDSFNTHGATLDKYRSMIGQWKKVGKDLTNRENILSVLDA